ncbi:4483_t:CDS:2, partial [Entrophospora sp. SA101]
QRFKDAEITRECYMKLNKPVKSNNPTYTYLNLIIDHETTEKNSIAFGMAVTLNYLDPSKGIKLIQKNYGHEISELKKDLDTYNHLNEIQSLYEEQFSKNK